jgi:hypothetical protein
MRKLCLFVLTGAVSLGSLAAQDIQRRAAIVRGGGPGGGDGCTIDVVIDGSADVEIRGDNAVIRNVAGGAPQFRQFDCTRPMPLNAPGFRFNPVDGRGHVELVRTPRDGGPVVVRIDDPQGGAGEYRFELTWNGAQPGYRREQGDRGYDQSRDGDRDHGQYQTERERYFQGEAWRTTLFQRVREDVEHLQHSTFPFTGDQSRLSTTIFELNELQDKLAQGRYDEHELRDVMESLTAMLQYNRLSARDREIITDDLSRMREFRGQHQDRGEGRGDGRGEPGRC